MICFECQKQPASVKMGNSKGSILQALLGRRCWSKIEIYLCRKCFEMNHRGDAREFGL